MAMHTYRCPRGHRTDLLHRRNILVSGEWLDVGERRAETSCETCGAVASLIPSSPMFRVARTNFYDASAGRGFADESAMKQWCRANNVSEDNGGGAFHFEAAIRAREDQVAREEADFADHQDKMANDPGLAPVRDLVDKGYYQDKARAYIAECGADPDKVKINLL